MVEMLSSIHGSGLANRQESSLGFRETGLPSTSFGDESSRRHDSRLAKRVFHKRPDGSLRRTGAASSTQVLKDSPEAKQLRDELRGTAKYRREEITEEQVLQLTEHTTFKFGKNGLGLNDVDLPRMSGNLFNGDMRKITDDTTAIEVITMMQRK